MNFSSLVPAIHNRKVKIVIIMVVRLKKINLYSINLQAPVEALSHVIKYKYNFHLCIKSTCILIRSQRNKSCKKIINNNNALYCFLCLHLTLS